MFLHVSTQEINNEKKKKQTVNILVAQTFDQNIYHVLKLRANFGPL